MYEQKVNDMLQTQCKLAVEQARLIVDDGKSIDDAWSFLRNSYQITLSSSLDVISKLTFQGLCNSIVMRDWLDANMA